MGSMASNSSSLIANSSFKKTAEELEETLRKKAELESSLEKRLVQLRGRLAGAKDSAKKARPEIVPEREEKEEDDDNGGEEFYDAKGDAPAPPAAQPGNVIADRKPPGLVEEKKGSPLEEAEGSNKEWKEKCEAMVKQLFEAKVAWADQNNTIRTDLEKMQKMSATTKESYEKLMGEYIWIKGEYARCMDSLKKYRARAGKSLGPSAVPNNALKKK